MSDQIIPVAAPIDSDSAGRGGAVATQACMRVMCHSTNSVGTGFLHKSGRIITAEHVIRGCNDPELILSNLTKIKTRVVALDPVLDLAILEPEFPVAAPAMALSASSNFAIGAHVSTWGYPGGYQGAAPMLSAGYLAAMDAHLIAGRTVSKWVVNAAFNSGNSGGPLLLIETGEVIGVVSSKLAPISIAAQQAFAVLESNQSGVCYNQTLSDGTTRTLVESQIVALIMNELRSQVQLVIGYAVLLDDLRVFLTANGVNP